MNIKSTLFGVLITLIVTILGGLAVYYITDKGNKDELLTYWYDTPAIFEKDSSSVILQTVYISNTGNEKATDISVEVSYPSGVKISEKNVVFSTGDITAFRDSIFEEKNFSLKTAILLPNENIKVSFILKSQDYSNPTVSLKSSSSIGIQSVINNSKNKKNNTLLNTLLLLLLAEQIAILFFFFKKRAFFKFESQQSSNNTAFLLLHKNLPDYAIKVLENTVFDSGADAYIIGNYALAKAIDGKFDESLKLIDAAIFYSYNQEERSMNLFNASLIYFLKGELIVARKKLEEAIAIDAKHIKEYIEFSDLIRDLRLNPEINEIFTNITKQHFPFSYKSFVLKSGTSLSLSKHNLNYPHSCISQTG